MLARRTETCQGGYMKFKYVSGRRSLDFVGTLKHRGLSKAEELLIHAAAAVGAGRSKPAWWMCRWRSPRTNWRPLSQLREAIYRIVSARLEAGESSAAEVGLVNEHASQPQLAPRLQPDGSISRAGTVPQLLARLAADLLDMLAGSDIGKVRIASTQTARGSTSIPRGPRPGTGAAWAPAATRSRSRPSASASAPRGLAGAGRRTARQRPPPRRLWQPGQ